jgi:hypothetical protein
VTGTLGTNTNSPFVDPGTLSRTASPAPGPLGSGSNGLAKLVASGHSMWKRIDGLNDWRERIENYAQPRNRQAQLVKDSTDLPVKFLEALGFEVDAIPLMKLWKAEIEFLAKFLQAGLQAQARAAAARQQWEDAARIARDIGPRAEKAANTFKPPDQKPYVRQWDAIVRWESGPRGSRGLDSGIFMGQGYYFRVSSLEELNRIASFCQHRILRHAGRVILTYLFLKVAQGSVLRLAAASENTLDSMMDSKNSLAQIVGAREALERTLETGDPAEADPASFVASPLHRLGEVASLWFRAADCANRLRPVL